MSTAIAAVVASVLGSVGAYFTWKCSKYKQREAAKAELANETAAADRVKDEIRQAVYTNDDAKLNQIANQLMKD